MDAFTPSTNSVSEDFDIKLDASCLLSDMRRSGMEHEEHIHCCVGETAREVSLKEENYVSITGDNSHMAQDLGNALDEYLQIQERDKLHCQGNDQACQDIDKQSHLEGTSDKVEQHAQSKMHQASGSISKIGKGLSKCATFPCSEKLLSSPFSTDEEEMPGDGSLKMENASCTRSNSLPTLKLVSAMKGSRERQGTFLKSKLSVTWAPDVYDPPTTTLSHTVKSHSQQRPKTRKKDHKHKHSKGKSTRGSSGSDKRQQHANRKSSGNTESLHLRWQAAAASGDRILLKSYDEPRKLMAPSTEVVEFAVSSQDSNCGSSFLRESLKKVHLPYAEAT